MSFPTKCNNNVAIDYADPNYFASSTLDQPGLLVWDRRATSRPVASSAYSQAVDESDFLPWGAALRLDRAIEPHVDSMQTTDSKSSFIRSLRFNRDHRGLLACLSRTGQLKVLKLTKEPVQTAQGLDGSPELLQSYSSHELDVSVFSSAKKKDSIVSFDWVPTGSNAMRPRILALRSSGVMEIIEMPAPTASHIYDVLPWSVPDRDFPSRPIRPNFHPTKY